MPRRSGQVTRRTAMDWSTVESTLIACAHHRSPLGFVNSRPREQRSRYSGKRGSRSPARSEKGGNELARAASVLPQLWGATSEEYPAQETRSDTRELRPPPVTPRLLPLVRQRPGRSSQPVASAQRFPSRGW